MKKNDIVKIKITSATAEGSGVGKTEDNIVVFVPMTAIGDEIEARILKVKKTYAFGKIEKIITPSAARISPDCPNFSKCGGCVWRHISYDEELKIKSKKVKDAVERIGGISTEFRPIIGSDRVNRYRNKAQFPVGKDKEGGAVIGFYAFHSHRIIDCDDCALQPEIFKTVMDVTRDFIERTNTDIYDESTGKGRLRHLYIRLGEVTNELMVCYVVNGNGLKQEDMLVKMLRESLPNLKTVVFNSNREKTNVILGNKNRVAYGKGYITDVLCRLKFKISPFSFWQVNRAQAEKLYSKAKEYAKLSGDEVLLDLYCGTGTIGQLRKEGTAPDVVILDPPRKGCGEELVKTIRKMNPKRVVYVSCDPATLARDLKYFSENGYITHEVTPCDMFPRTAHCESVALLTKN